MEAPPLEAAPPAEAPPHVEAPPVEAPPVEAPPPVNRDVEEQPTPEALPQDGTSDPVLMMCGFHVFCGTPLYCAPYALRKGGLVGISLLYSYFFLSFISALEVGLCMTSQAPLYNFKNYSDLGEAAFGVKGKYHVAVIEFLVTHASCMESFVILRDAVEYATPITGLMSDQSVIVLSLFWIVVTVLLTVVCEVVDAERHDKLLTGIGSFMSIVVVCCLFWPGAYSDVKENVKTTKFITTKLPVANGVYAIFFSGHPYLPKLYCSIRSTSFSRYYKILLGIFLPSLIVYEMACYRGYYLFGTDVQPVFILNMPLEYLASNVAVWSMALHQLIRYIMGIEAMTESIIQRRGRRWYLPRVIVKFILVVTTVPLTVAYELYGLFVALEGSLLGIIVALLVPCVCSLKLRRNTMYPYEAQGLILVIFVACIASLLGTFYSAVDIHKETGFTFFGIFEKKDN